MMSQNNYSQNGVEISKSNVSVGDEITITYQGFLASNGAETLSAHLGYGEHDWEEVQEVVMKKEKNGSFKAKIKITNQGQLNLCFKDGWNNWDNNSYRNYSFNIANKKAIKKAESKEDAITQSAKTIAMAASTKSAAKVSTGKATKKTAVAASAKSTQTSVAKAESAVVNAAAQKVATTKASKTAAGSTPKTAQKAPK